MPESAGLFQIVPELLIAVGFHRQDVVFLRQAEIAGGFPPDDVKKVEKEEVDAQRQETGEH